MDYFFDYTSQITNQFIDPKKRVFLFYILISILIATAWFMINKKLSFKKTLIKIFDKKIFFSKSAKSDYKIFLINQLIMMIVSPFLITQLTIATALYFYFHTIDWLSSGMFLGIANRMAPQVQIAFLGMSIKSFLGIMMLMVAWYFILKQFANHTQSWLLLIDKVISYMKLMSQT